MGSIGNTVLRFAIIACEALWDVTVRQRWGIFGAARVGHREAQQAAPMSVAAPRTTVDSIGASVLSGGRWRG